MHKCFGLRIGLPTRQVVRPGHLGHESLTPEADEPGLLLRSAPLSLLPEPIQCCTMLRHACVGRVPAQASSNMLCMQRPHLPTRMISTMTGRYLCSAGEYI